MSIGKVFIILSNKNKDFNRWVSQRGIIGSTVAKSKLFPVLKTMILIVVVFGIASLIPGAIKKAKISVTADITDPSILAPSKHFTTIINGQSLNELSTPVTEAGWTFEKDHLDTVIASGHARGLYERNRSDAIKTNLTKYMLINSTEGPMDTPDQSEIQEMHDFCVGTGTMPDGYPMPGLSEDEAENIYLHFYDDTVVNNLDIYGNVVPRTIKGWGGGTASSKQEARIVNNMKYGNFYVLNPKSQCDKAWKAYSVYKTVHDAQPMVKYGSENTIDGGVIYDGVFVDEFFAGSIAFMRPVASGGKIIEYGNRTRDEIDADFTADQATLLTYIKNDVAGRLGHDFLLTLNSAEAIYTDDPHAAPAIAAGGVTTEMFSSEAQFSGLGREFYNWGWAKYITSRGGYFAWSQREPDSVLAGNPVYNYSASNYAGATGGIKLIASQQVAEDSTGKEARHDMVSLVSYLIAKDRNNRMIYAQRAWGEDSWDLPMSSWWMKAREMNIGQPTTDQYAIVADNINDQAGQPYKMYRRDYDNGVALIREYNGYPAGDWDYSVQSQPYEIDPTNHTAYRIVYPDGTLSPNTYTSITLAYGEGVVLVPDGYDPMSGGPTPTTDANISLSEGGTHIVGDTFSVTASIATNTNNVCGVNLQIQYPADKVTINQVSPVSPFSLTVANNIDNLNGILTYTGAAPQCTRLASAPVLTIEFRAIGAGTDDINILSANLAGGEDPSQVAMIPSNIANTSVTIENPVPILPVTVLTITNNVTPNINGYYTVAPIIQLKATASSGNTVSNIKYQWNTDAVQTQNGDTIDNLSITQDGLQTLKYYATDSAGNVEFEKSQNFNIDLTPPGKPIVDPYDQHTYKDKFTLKGTKTIDVNAILINNSAVGVVINGSDWQKEINLPLLTESDPGSLSGQKVKAQEFIVSGEDAAGNQNAAETVYVSRHPIGDMNGDLIIGTIDFGGFVDNWSGMVDILSDLNLDSTCNLLDLAIMMLVWNQP